MPPPTRRLSRAERARLGTALAAAHDGVAHRRDLRAAKIGRADVRTEVEAGRWKRAGRQTVLIGNGELGARALLWRAVWESGGGAVLDGVAALLAGGLTGFDTSVLDVSIPRNNRSHRVPGVRRHRRDVMPPVRKVGIPRVEVPTAAIHAAVWSTTDRQAALVLCLVLQQRLTSSDRLMRAWRSTTARMPRARSEVLSLVVADLCDGAHSLGELDFSALCRKYGLPVPSRQVVRTLPGGRVYLDVRWERVGLVVEVDGGHHALALSVLDDALRQNEVVLLDDRVLRVPVLGLRIAEDEFMAQVVRAHSRWGPSAA